MAAGVIPSPLIIPTEVPARDKKIKLSWNCNFEITCQDHRCTIYYTIDKTSPSWWTPPRAYLKMTTDQRKTLLYKSPFWLMSGKRTIKAVAVGPDGRESFTVTRVFHVADRPSEEKEYSAEISRNCADLLLKKQTSPPKSKPVEEPECIHQTVVIDFYDTPKKWPTCHYCGCEYAAAEYAEQRFCSQCSKPIPHYNKCEPDDVYQGCNGVCPSCSSFCPLDAIACPVCDVSLPERKIAEIRLNNLGEKICPSCSHISPNEATNCQLCELRFPLPIMVGQAAPPKLKPAEECVECTGCGRRCTPEARICDWCGVSLHNALPQECPICSISLPPFVLYCSQCGIYFDPPARLDPRNSALGEKIRLLEFENLPQWASVPLPDVTYDEPITWKEIPKPVKPTCLPRSVQVPPVLTPTQNVVAAKVKNSVVSAGNGFWRQQAEFLTQHHTNLANFDPLYRQQIADLKLGQLIESNITFDKEDDEKPNQIVTVGLKFARVDHPDYPSKMDQTVRELYQNLAPTLKKRNLKKKSASKVMKKAEPSENSHLTHFDRMLLAELAPRGQGRLLQMAQNIEQGANVNCKDSAGRTPLYNATMRNNRDSVESLIAAGANVDYQYDRRNDTLVHIAIEKKFIEILDVLLRAGASINLKNREKKSAYEVAILSENKEIIQLVNQQHSKCLLKTQKRPKSILRVTNPA